MSFGFWQLVIIALLGVLLFGRGRISDLMGDVAKGIKSFKKGLSEDDTDMSTNKKEPPKKIVSETQMTDITPSSASSAESEAPKNDSHTEKN